MSFPRVGIVGLGLIGGSLAKLIREVFPDTHIVGVSPNEAVRAQALQDGALSAAGADMGVLSEMDLVFVATPIEVVVDTVKALQATLSPRAIVTDVASVKRDIVAAISASAAPRQKDVFFKGLRPLDPVSGKAGSIPDGANGIPSAASGISGSAGSFPGGADEVSGGASGISGSAESFPGGAGGISGSAGIFPGGAGGVSGNAGSFPGGAGGGQGAQPLGSSTLCDLAPPNHKALFIGGHPMAGKETTGYAASEAQMLIGATYVLMPSPDPRRQAFETYLKDLKFRVVTMSPEDHDEAVALASHGPYVMACLTAGTLLKSPYVDAGKQLISSGFRDTTRVACSPAQWGAAVCLDNADAVLAFLQSVSADMGTLSALITSGDAAALTRYFETIAVQRRGLFPV